MKRSNFKKYVCLLLIVSMVFSFISMSSAIAYQNLDNFDCSMQDSEFSEMGADISATNPAILSYEERQANRERAIAAYAHIPIHDTVIISALDDDKIVEAKPFYISDPLTRAVFIHAYVHFSGDQWRATVTNYTNVSSILTKLKMIWYNNHREVMTNAKMESGINERRA